MNILNIFKRDKKKNISLENDKIYEILKTTGEKNIIRHPNSIQFPWKGEKITKIPSYNYDSEQSFQIDLRSKNLSQIPNFNNTDIENLLMADFDSQTTRPNNLPTTFNPEKIIEDGKNPGLEIKELHKKGITGKGVGIGIIDSVLLTNHSEYKDNLIVYDEINPLYEYSAMHGPAVSSIAVGKQCGVAPESGLYYISAIPGKKNQSFKDINNAIKKILKDKKTLHKENIRVISISAGCNKGSPGYTEFLNLVNECQKQGIFVISANLGETHQLHFQGLGREPLANAEDKNSYTPGLFRKKRLNQQFSKIQEQKRHETQYKNLLLIPMDSRTTASLTGNEDFVFYRNGGISRCIPYIAGLYALVCQTYPEITPEVFWEKALTTGDIAHFKNNNAEDICFGKIINPTKLLNLFSNKEKLGIKD